MTNKTDFKHGQEGTHTVCDTRLKNDGGKALCCYCMPHQGCDLVHQNNSDRMTLHPCLDSGHTPPTGSHHSAGGNGNINFKPPKEWVEQLNDRLDDLVRVARSPGETKYNESEAKHEIKAFVSDLLEEKEKEAYNEGSSDTATRYADLYRSGDKGLDIVKRDIEKETRTSTINEILGMIIPQNFYTDDGGFSTEKLKSEIKKLLL